VAWLGLARGAQQATDLSVAVDDAVGSNLYDARVKPRPHLTVARGVSEQALTDLRALAAEIELAWAVDRITLFRSYTERSGSKYEVLAQHELRG
jgi:2'-5' RNA ligase